MRPCPAIACSSIAGRSTISRNAWRTRTSVKGFWSMRMLSGSQPAPAFSKSTSDDWPVISLVVAKGTSDMTSIWPAISALIRAVSSSRSITVTWSRYGSPPPRQ